MSANFSHESSPLQTVQKTSYKVFDEGHLTVLTIMKTFQVELHVEHLILLNDY